MMSICVLQICMDCYEDDDNRLQASRSVISAAKVKRALEHFRIPTGLWPPGVRMAAVSQPLREQYAKHLRKLMTEAVQVGHVIMAWNWLSLSIVAARHVTSLICSFVNLLPNDVHVRLRETACFCADDGSGDQQGYSSPFHEDRVSSMLLLQADGA